MTDHLLLLPLPFRTDLHSRIPTRTNVTNAFITRNSVSHGNLFLTGGIVAISVVDLVVGSGELLHLSYRVSFSLSSSFCFAFL